jgi:hypothetical protein
MDANGRKVVGICYPEQYKTITRVFEARHLCVGGNKKWHISRGCGVRRASRYGATKQECRKKGNWFDEQNRAHVQVALFIPSVR